MLLCSQEELCTPVIMRFGICLSDHIYLILTRGGHPQAVDTRSICLVVVVHKSCNSNLVALILAVILARLPFVALCCD